MHRITMILIILALAVSIVQAVTVTGTVFLPDGKPAAGVPVVVTDFSHGKEVAQTCTTNGTGVFSMQRTASMYWYGYVVVMAPGCAIYCGFLKTRANIIQLQHEGTLICHVVDEEGHAVAGAALRVTSMSPAGQDDLYYCDYVDALKRKFCFTTDAEGRGVITGLPQVGTVSLRLEDDRFIGVYRHTDLTPDAPPLTITAHPGGTIAGKVIAADGKPAAGVKVKAIGQYASGSTEPITAADGTYRIGGLQPATYCLCVVDPAGKGAAAPVDGVKVQAGKSAQANIRLQSGVLLTGTVVDAADGKPLSGLTVLSYPMNANKPSYNGTVEATTDATGRYRFRVMPGKYNVQVTGWRLGSVYISSKENRSGLPVDVKAPQTTAPPLKVTRGLTVTGVVTDAQGKPLADQCIGVAPVPGKHGEVDGTFALTLSDGTGHFTVSGLQAGSARFITNPPYQETPEPTITPKTFQLPAAQPLHVVLSPAPVLPRFAGRVVTPEGAPVPGVRVEFGYKSDNNGRYYGSDAGQCMTGLDGRYALIARHTGRNVLLVKAERKGYRLRSGGKITAVNGDFQVSDIVLAPPVQKVSGTVVDTAGKPVEGATVFAPDAGWEMIAVTDAQGQFALTAVPEGELTLMAARGYDAGHLTAKTGTAPLTIPLTPGEPPTPADAESGLAVLEQVWRESPTSANWLLATIAERDPDRALKFAQRDNGGLPTGALTAIITSLARTDPAKAASWAPVHLALIPAPEDRLHALLALGTAVVEKEPGLAAELYRQAKELVMKGGLPNEIEEYFSVTALAVKLKNGEAPALYAKIKALVMLASIDRKEGYYVRLAQLASELKNGEAPALLAKALAVNPKSDHAYTLAQMALADQQLVEQELAKLPAPKRNQVIGDIISVLGPVDPAALPHWLAKIDTTKDVNAKYLLDERLSNNITSMAKKSPAQALVLARKIAGDYQRATALLRVASYLPKAAALQVYQEAAELITAYPEFQASTLARIAAQADLLDHALGVSLYRKAKTRMDAAMEEAFRYSHNEVIFFARAAASFAPAESRRLLETVYASNQQQPDSDGKAREFADLATAMTALDLDRALEITHSIASKEYQHNALCTIGNYLLADEAARRAWELQ